MASSSSDHRRSSRSSHAARQRTGSRSSRRSGRVHNTTPEHKPLQKRDTGYRVGRGKTSSRRDGLAGRIRDPRMIFVGIVGLIVVGVLIFGISSWIKGCTSTNRAKREKAEEQEAINTIDPRVSAKADEETTAKLGNVLDLSEAYEDIAKNADQIDPKLIDLAVAEPEAVPFVKGYPEADKVASGYDENVTKGTYPLLYTWDTRWGYTSYAEGIAGVTASGPVALSIAAMGLTGTSTNDPVAVMSAVTAAELANGATGMGDLFVTEHAGDIGLSAEALDVSGDSIATAYYGESPVLLARIKTNSPIGSVEAHWALVTKQNEDGSYTVIDPTSAIASSHTWAAGTIAGASDALYRLGKAGETDAATDLGEGEATDTATDETAYDDTEVYEYDAEGNPIY